MKDKRKEQGKKQRELAAMEQDIREKDAEISRKKPTFIKAKERVKHLEKKLESAKKSLGQAKKAHDAHMDDIHELERELKEVEEKRDEYENQIAGESQSKGRDVQLEDAQVKEYNRSVNTLHFFRLESLRVPFFSFCGSPLFRLRR